MLSIVMATRLCVFYKIFLPLVFRIKVYSRDRSLTPKMQLAMVNGKGKRPHSSTGVMAVSEAEMTGTPASMLHAEDTEPALGMADPCA